MSNTQLQSQMRANYAYECINQCQQWDKDTQKQLKAYVQSLPAMIQMNGFGQAIAFYKSHPQNKKGGIAYQAIYKWLSAWLNQQGIYQQELMDAICQGSMQDYQLATAESQALLVWLKKFVRAYVVTDDEPEA
jgi:CRISPR-associated protein Cmr5